MAGYRAERQTQEQAQAAQRGLIALFARHRTAPNLLMALLLIAGAYGWLQISSQFFPEIVRERVSITVSWPGASAEDVDDAIIQVVEPYLANLEDLDEMSSSATEGSGRISLEYKSGTNMVKALGDVETGLSLLTQLPEDGDEPRARSSAFRDLVSRIVISGPMERSTLIEYADDLRDGLLDRGLLQVDVVGDATPEILISVGQEQLRSLSLDLGQVAARIRALSNDTPAGQISGGEGLVRTVGQRKEADDFAGVTLQSLRDGSVVRLGDIANISETSAEDGVEALVRGDNAVELQIQRGAGGDSIKQQALVEAYLKEFEQDLPQALSVDQYNIRADIVSARLWLLIENGAMGLVIVLALLFIFLNARTAFWVAAGIPISLGATLFIMWASGQSLNMISMFGLIVTLGIIVDDAIVVGEHADDLYSQGFDPATAAVLGGQRMSAPVVSAALTTIVAFATLFAIGGRFGQIIQAIPFAVVAVLIASLIECFLVLPGHMHHSLAGRARRARGRKRVGLGILRVWFDRGFDWFRKKLFRNLVRLAIVLRYPVLAASIGGLMLAIGMVASGQINFRFFVAPELNLIRANLQMLPTASRDDTRAMVQEMDRAMTAAAQKLDPEGWQQSLVLSVGKVGDRAGGFRGAGGAPTNRDLVGGLIVELVEEDQRPFKTSELMRTWRRELKEHPRTESVSARRFRGGPGGEDVDIRLIGGEARDLKAAAGELIVALEDQEGIAEAEDDMPFGNSEYILEITPRGEALGLNISEIGQQLRNGIEGVVADRFTRDGDDISVRVQFPNESLDAGFIYDFEVRTTAGVFVPLSDAVTVREQQGFAIVRRFDGKRQISVTAELADDGPTSTEIEEALKASVLPSIQSRYGLEVDFEGRGRQQREFFRDAQLSGIVGMITIYGILAWVFSSYVRPIAVLAIIPMGFIGMIIGHWWHDMALSMFSVIGFIGLSGIIINDSIVLISTIDRRSKTQALRQAIIDGTTDRLRAVILTSATTIGGLIPLLFEPSVQARFLQPTVITMVYGLGFGTVMVLIIVPALVAVLGDCTSAIRSFRFFVSYLLSGRKLRPKA